MYLLISLHSSKLFSYQPLLQVLLLFYVGDKHCFFFFFNFNGELVGNCKRADVSFELLLSCVLSSFFFYLFIFPSTILMYEHSWYEKAKDQ